MGLEREAYPQYRAWRNRTARALSVAWASCSLSQRVQDTTTGHTSTFVGRRRAAAEMKTSEIRSLGWERE